MYTGSRREDRRGIALKRFESLNVRFIFKVGVEGYGRTEDIHVVF